MPGRIISYAQNFEDVLLWRALYDVANGFYIDVGAQDPIADSVSRAFYEKGWRGVHVEPTSSYAERLRSDRPDETVIQAAVSDKPGLLTFFEIPDTGMSTADPEIAARAADMGWPVNQTSVLAVTFDQLLDLSAGHEVHWLKVDVEGFEGQALQGWRESAVRPWVIVIESVAPYTREPMHEAWEGLLLNKGYEFTYFDGLNRYYVSEAHPELREHLTWGPSVWDEFQLPDHSRLITDAVTTTRRSGEPLDKELRFERQNATTQTGSGNEREETTAGGNKARDSHHEADRLRNALLTSLETCTSVQRSFAQSDSALTQCRADLVFAHDELKRAKAEAQQARDESERATALAAHHLSEVEELRSSISQLRRDYTAFQEASLRSSVDLANINSQVTAQLESTTAALTQVRVEFDALQDGTQRQLATLEQANVELRRDLQSAQADLARSEANCAGLAEAAAELSGANTDLRRELEETLQSVAQLRTGYATLQSAYDELHASAAEPEALRRESSLLRAAYEEQQTLSARLSGEIVAFRSVLGQVHAIVEDVCAKIAAPGSGHAPFPDLSAQNASTPAHSAEELLSYRDDSFVRKAYVTILGREADALGLEHFTSALRAGRGPMWVLESLMSSPEAEQVKADLSWLREAIDSRKPDTSVRARLSALRSGEIPHQPELESIALGLQQEISRFVQAQEVSAHRLTALHSGIRAIVDILAQPLAPEARMPLRIGIAEGEAWQSATLRREAERALLQSAANAGSLAPASPVALAIASPGSPVLQQGEKPILFGHDCDETGYPASWVESLNNHVTGVACTSAHVQKILIDHGVSVPIKPLGVGLDHWNRLIPAGLPSFSSKAFRFVHLARQVEADGTDLAVESYARVFGSTDDVVLVIACVPETEAKTRSLVERVQLASATCPEIVVAVGAWTDVETRALYEQCHALVSPARAAGFSVDIAHAALSGLDIIATRWGGHLDYCSDENASLLDFQFEACASPRHLVASAWTRPHDHLVDAALRIASSRSAEDRATHSEAHKAQLLDRYNWSRLASDLVEFAGQASNAPSLTSRRIGWVTTWNTRCGIAEAARHLIRSFDSDDVVIFASREDAPIRADEPNCRRLWVTSKDDNQLARISSELAEWSVGTLFINFNYGFYNHAELGDFIEDAIARGILVLVDLHSTVDPWPTDPNFRLDGFLPALRKCHRIFAHSPSDMNRLKAMGLVDNVVLFPLGVISAMSMPRNRRLAREVPLLSSFGFCLPNKGLIELVEAVGILRERGCDVKLRMLNAAHPHPHSAQEIDRLNNAIVRLGLDDRIELRTEYLEDDVCLDLLQQADLIVNPYQRTGEAASAAVRFAMASGCPVAVTPIPIFDDLGQAVFRTPGTSPVEIAEGIMQCLEHLRNDTPESRFVQVAATQWLATHDFGQQAKRLKGMVTALRLQGSPAFSS